MEFTCS